MKPLIGESPNRRTHVCTSPPLAPLPLWCVPALAARFPRAFCLPSAVCALSCCAPSRPPRGPVHPLTPSLAPLSRRPLPARAPAAPVRAPAATASFCALACRHVILRRAVAQPLSRPQSRRARSPCRSPTGPVQDSRDVVPLCRWSCRASSCVFACCCRAVAAVPPADPLTFARAHPDGPRALPAQTVLLI